MLRFDTPFVHETEFAHVTELVLSHLQRYQFCHTCDRIVIKKIETCIGKPAVSRQCILFEVEAWRFFASHEWTHTHQGQDLATHLDSVYCILRVHNTAFTVSGRDVHYKAYKRTRGFFIFLNIIFMSFTIKTEVGNLTDCSCTRVLTGI